MSTFNRRYPSAQVLAFADAYDLKPCKAQWRTVVRDVLYGKGYRGRQGAGSIVFELEQRAQRAFDGLFDHYDVWLRCDGKGYAITTQPYSGRTDSRVANWLDTAKSFGVQLTFPDPEKFPSWWNEGCVLILCTRIEGAPPPPVPNLFSSIQEYLAAQKKELVS